MRLKSVFCFWRWQEKSRTWKLAESYAVTDAGYSLSGNSKATPDTWVGDECDPIRGRAVTCWNVEFGVELCRFVAPEKATWLSVVFVDKLKRMKGWSELLQDGHTLVLGTARAVERLTEEQADEQEQKPGNT